jgi:UDP-3-O-[3-hydroxymyristoyl] glucosamine N-acyltransferase
MIAARAGLNRDVATRAVVAGFPAIPHKTWLKAAAVMGKLPELREQLRKMATRLEALEAAASPSRSTAGRAVRSQRKSKPRSLKRRSR